MVVFRLLQGMCGAALVPLSQATMLDIYPAAQRGQAMAIWGVGVMIGPILGPTLGGYLTEMYNWRWVFYVNLPFGILATLGLALCMSDSKGQPMRFDWIGFAVLALGLGAFQLDARPRPGPGLVQLARDHHRGDAGRPRALPVRGPSVVGPAPVHPARACSRTAISPPAC